MKACIGLKAVQRLELVIVKMVLDFLDICSVSHGERYFSWYLKMVEEVLSGLHSTIGAENHICGLPANLVQ